VALTVKFQSKSFKLVNLKEVLFAFSPLGRESDTNAFKAVVEEFFCSMRIVTQVVFLFLLTIFMEF
jgi:hypothetical protein